MVPPTAWLAILEVALDTSGAARLTTPAVNVVTAACLREIPQEKLMFRALSHLILEAVPADPGRDEFRQGNTLGTAYRHWRRAKIGRRFRLFFRYDSRSKVIVYAWVNDENTLRSAGSKSDPYMLGRGNPPDDWDALTAATRSDWDEPKA
ncbi:type II toxin-antitoxin system YhaV family toxin [Pseudomonas sp. SDI]|uniref:type II toxin-antitoxin system YhaV family toxin n=1 Tax=Pseudomonas sp. SDI TaxID=2170734 RepID=UPI002113BB55|nr:type II toxin-antitoxin system YhaV family toxin [Pseudomonas sp. SDI]